MPTANRSNSPVVFFVRSGALLLGLSLLTLVPYYHEFVETPLTKMNAALTHYSLGWIGVETELKDQFVYGRSAENPFSIEVIPECTGVFPALILIALTIGFPSPWKARGLGLGLGLALIFLLNWVRLVSLFLLGGHVSKETFEELHVIVWQGVFIVAVAVYWYWWAQRSVPKLDSSETESKASA